MPWLSVLLVLLFVLIGGVFAAAEMALISLRESQLRALAQRGRRGAKVAKLTADPNRFLAAVQVGVTFAGFLSAAFGAATLATPLRPVLERLGADHALADVGAVVLVTLAVAYVSIVFGELAAKRLALQRAETFALGLAPTLDRVAALSRPVIWLLSRSTDVVVRLLGGDPRLKREAISEEELRDLVAAHESLPRDERQLIMEVFAAGERQIREVMVPRTEVDFLDAGLPVAKAAATVLDSPHSRFPVFRGSHDTVVGFVHVRDLLASSEARRRATRVGELAREVMLLPDSRTVLAALSDLRRAGQHIAVVVDEYGGTAGIVTLEDVIEELVGEIHDEYDPARRSATQLTGGDVEVDGLLNLDEFAEATGCPLPDGPYETAAGYVLAVLGRLPRLGDDVTVGVHRLTVTELDGRRIARLRVAADDPIAPPPASPAPPASP